MSSRKFSQLWRAVITRTVYKKLWWQQTSCAGTSLPLKQFECQSLQFNCLDGSLLPNEMMGAEQKVLLELLEANKCEREALSKEHRASASPNLPGAWSLALSWAPKSVLPEAGSIPQTVSRQLARRAPSSSTEAKRHRVVISWSRWALLDITQAWRRQKKVLAGQSKCWWIEVELRGNGEGQGSAGRKWWFV